MSEQLQNTILFSQQAIDFGPGGSILRQVERFWGGPILGQVVDFGAGVSIFRGKWWSILPSFVWRSFSRTLTGLCSKQPLLDPCFGKTSTYTT